MLPILGDVIADQYRLDSVLGEGGFARVFLAGNPRVKSMKYAVKVLLPQHAGRPEVRDRFIREASSAAALRSRHVVRTINFGETHGVPFLVMEYVHGETLERVINRTGGLSVGVALRIAADVLRALDEAHALGIVHRDIKPENILLAHEPGQARPIAKVSDFGIAKVADNSPAAGEGPVTQEGLVMCTPQYASPEVLRLKPEPRSDLYALGHVLYQMVEARPAFGGDAIVDIIAQHLSNKPIELGPRTTGSAVDAIIRKAGAKSVKDRYASANEMLEAVTLALRTVSPVDDQPLKLAVRDVRRTTSSIGLDVSAVAAKVRAEESTVSPTLARTGDVSSLLGAMTPEDIRARFEQAEASAHMLPAQQVTGPHNVPLLPSTLPPDETPTIPRGHQESQSASRTRPSTEVPADIFTPEPPLPPPPSANTGPHAMQVDASTLLRATQAAEAVTSSSSPTRRVLALIALLAIVAAGVVLASRLRSESQSSGQAAAETQAATEDDLRVASGASPGSGDTASGLQPVSLEPGPAQQLPVEPVLVVPILSADHAITVATAVTSATDAVNTALWETNRVAMFMASRDATVSINGGPEISLPVIGNRLPTERPVVLLFAGEGADAVELEIDEHGPIVIAPGFQITSRQTARSSRARPEGGNADLRTVFGR